MVEKDTLGDKLHLKERADEDRYFAKRDQELIEQLRKQREGAEEGTIREIARFRCPDCGQRLEEHVVHGLNVSVCPGCQGTWLAKGKLDHLTQHKDDKFLDGFFRGLIRLMEGPHAPKP
jgi:hypothetical protein